MIVVHGSSIATGWAHMDAHAGCRGRASSPRTSGGGAPSSRRPWGCGSPAVPARRTSRRRSGPGSSSRSRWRAWISGGRTTRAPGAGSRCNVVCSGWRSIRYVSRVTRQPCCSRSCRSASTRWAADGPLDEPPLSTLAGAP